MELDLGDSPRATENKLSTVKDGNMKRPNVDSLELDLNELPRVTENELSNVNNGKISPEKTREIQTTNEPGIGKSSIPKKVLLATRRRKLAAERSEAKRLCSCDILVSHCINFFSSTDFVNIDCFQSYESSD